MTMTKTKGKLLDVVAATMLVGMAGIGTAHADNHGHGGGRPGPGHDRDWHAHEVRNRHWHGPHYIEEPGVVYAPPAVVYAPPEPSPGINLVLPMNFR